jgi:hypothetical protein
VGCKNLEEWICAYFVDPAFYPCPEALSDHWARGDYRMLIAGGVDDQPAGRWQAANQAGRTWHVLDNARRYGDDMHKYVEPGDLTHYIEVLLPMRMKFEQAKAERDAKD